MLIPLIANGPLQGPSPTPIPGRGAEKDRATQDATKDAFGALFQEGNVTKSITQTPKAQDANIPAEPKTAESETGIEVTAGPEGATETEHHVAPDPRVDDMDDQEYLPTFPNSTLESNSSVETTVTVRTTQPDPITRTDYNDQVDPNNQTQINETDRSTDFTAAQNASPLSMAANAGTDYGSVQESVVRNTVPLNARPEAAPEPDKAITIAQMTTKETLLPGQQNPGIIATARPTPDWDVFAPKTPSAEKVPVEAANGPPLAASAAAIMTKATPASATPTQHGQATSLGEIGPMERASEQTVKTEWLTVPNTPVNPAAAAPQAPPLVTGQPANPLDLSKRLIPEVEASDPDEQPLVFEARAPGGATGAMAVSTQALLQRADLPQHIAMQIAASAQRGGADRPVDIILNPAELGRVRLSLSSTDGVMSVTVIAERPETLDLMRRHIDTLAQEFLNIGYEKAQFSFGGGHSGQTGQNDGEASFSSSGGSGQHDPMTGTPDLNHSPILISDRLDIRL